ncbi:MAG TPA: orotidine-5'-phosphate decarboxylase [Myxococcota bacterium]|nr:orotidine-5'-phosphate decarboxylase [Myxococcota bacterium]
MDAAKEVLIIALDDLERDEALEVVKKTWPYAQTYKIGLALYSAYGASLVRDIQDLGAEVFLDLKFHDIPMQVQKAVERCLVLKPRFLTLHASGGFPMMAEAAKVAASSKTTILAVTVLTSIDTNEAQRLGFNETIEERVLRLSALALEAGIFGLVSSPKEAFMIKKHYGSRAFLVCPGVRLKNDAALDQARIMTPKDAIMAGANRLVVGRPITAAQDMAKAAEIISLEIKEALASREATNAL